MNNQMKSVRVYFPSTGGLVDLFIHEEDDEAIDRAGFFLRHTKARIISCDGMTQPEIDRLRAAVSAKLMQAA